MIRKYILTQKDKNNGCYIYKKKKKKKNLPTAIHSSEKQSEVESEGMAD